MLFPWREVIPHNSFVLIVNIFLPLRIILHSFLFIHTREGAAVVPNAKEDKMSLDLGKGKDSVGI